jgi:hypothetical protein
MNKKFYTEEEIRALPPDGDPGYINYPKYLTKDPKDLTPEERVKREDWMKKIDFIKNFKENYE